MTTVWFLLASVCEMDTHVNRRGSVARCGEGRVAGSEVGHGGEEGQHLAIDVDAQGTDGEDVAADVEFAVAERGE